MKYKFSMGICPACHKRLSKKYRRSLSPLEWEKLQTSYWMEAWHRELEHGIELEKRLNKISVRRTNRLVNKNK